MKPVFSLCLCLLGAGCRTVTQPETAVPVALETQAASANSGGPVISVTRKSQEPSAVIANIYADLETGIKTGAPGAQDAAIRRLVELGDARAVVVLGGILEDENLSDQTRRVANAHPSGTDHVVYDTLAGMTVRALGKMGVAGFEHPDYSLEVVINKEEVARWRTWWREHKTSLIEQARLTTLR